MMEHETAAAPHCYSCQSDPCRCDVRDEKDAPAYRIALRPDDRGELDDVVVNDVEMFRAEMMDNRSLWMCCYLEGHDRVNFWVTVKRGRLHFTVTEQPADVVYEAGSL